MFTLEHNKRPYAVPLLCPVCRTLHRVKTYHIAVDSEGFAFVSHEVWQMMKKYNTSGFQVANEVAAPPAQRIDLGTAMPTSLEIING